MPLLVPRFSHTPIVQGAHCRGLPVLATHPPTCIACLTASSMRYSGFSLPPSTRPFCLRSGTWGQRECGAGMLGTRERNCSLSIIVSGSDAARPRPAALQVTEHTHKVRTARRGSEGDTNRSWSRSEETTCWESSRFT